MPVNIFLGEKRRVPIEHVRITNQIRGERNRLKSNLKFTGHFLVLFTCHVVKSHELYFRYLDYFLLILFQDLFSGFGLLKTEFRFSSKFYRSY